MAAGNVVVNANPSSTIDFNNYFITSWSANTTTVALNPAMFPGSLTVNINGCVYPTITSLEFDKHFTASVPAGTTGTVEVHIPDIPVIQINGVVPSGANTINFGSGILAEVSTNVVTVSTFMHDLSQLTGITIGACYSVRLMNPGYFGNCMQVRRSSDNTISNIGFNVNGGLDTVGLLAFVGANNGFVSTWYDQSGNSLDIAQATVADQPQIVTSGVVNTNYGIPALSFSGSDVLVSSAQSILSSGSTNSLLSCVATCSSSSGSPTAVTYGANSSSQTRSIYISGSNQWGVSTVGSFVASDAYIGDTTAFGCLFTSLSPNTYIQMYTNGNFAGSGSVATIATPASSSLYVGASYTGSNWNGTIQEVICLNGRCSSNTIKQIQDSQVNYFNL